MPTEQREEFERRLLALVRLELDAMDEDYPHGWEISDFVITARTHYAPEPGTPLDPWAGGPYPGWYVSAWTRGTSPAYWYDAELLYQALEYSNKRHSELQQSDSEDAEDEDVED